MENKLSWNTIILFYLLISLKYLLLFYCAYDVNFTQ